jgi:hypothetical protein
MLPPPKREVGMGFLDKLLGRDKDTGTSTVDAPSEVETKASEPPAETESPSPEGEGSDITHSEQRLDDVRDQVLRDEDRMP